MLIPSKKQQVQAVMKFLDSEHNEGRSLEEIATDIVEGYHTALTANLKPSQPLRVGMLFKTPVDGKVRRVAWLDDERGEWWAVHETSSYGWLGHHSPLWDYREEYRPKRRIEIDGKGKMVEMTDDEITEAWANPDYSVGQQVSQRQRQFLHEIIATGPQCVLLEDVKTKVLTVESNRNLGAYYKKEIRW